MSRPPKSSPPDTPAEIKDAVLQELPLDGINLAVYNPRKDLKPGDREWRNIEAALLTYGNLGGMVYNSQTGNLVGGHQRVKILRHHGRTKAIFAVVDLGPNEEKALNIALNRLGEGAWDRARLAGLLEELRGAAFDIEALGFTRPDLSALLKKENKRHKADPDAPAPNLPAVPLTREGDVFDIITKTAHHRLVCGDARSLATIDALMQGAKAHLVHLDPPYGVAYKNADRGGLINDDLESVSLIAMLTDFLKNASAASMDAAPLYLWHAAKKRREFYAALDASGWEDTQEIIWGKTLILSRSHYHWNHEPALYCRKYNQRPAWHGDRKQTTFFDQQPDWRKMSKEEAVDHLRQLYEQEATIQRASRDSAAELIHPTQKPIIIPGRAIVNSSQPGEIVLDLTAGSGSTLIAAEEHDRHARAIEQDPGYCDLIVRRFFNTYETPPDVLHNGQQITVDAFGADAIAKAHGHKKRTKKPAP